MKKRKEGRKNLQEERREEKEKKLTIKCNVNVKEFDVITKKRTITMIARSKQNIGRLTRRLLT